MPGSSLFYVIPNKKGFLAKRNPLSNSLAACAQIAPLTENSLQFHGFVKQNLGNNSVAVNALGKDAYGSAGSFKILSEFDPEYLKTSESTAKSHTGVHVRLEPQKFAGFL